MATLNDTKGPFFLANQPHTNHSINLKNVSVPCLGCSKSFQFNEEKDEYLAHLFLIHRLVIADVQHVAFLHEYLKYWKCRFNGKYKIISFNLLLIRLQTHMFYCFLIDCRPPPF